ncbi:helix-turn-helix domain-containing protein [Lysobacter capsici]|uniref:helix-turn-helix domain-containing protein n=1 Tax=Lysobacter capsici TaxID=435897 RepID=UPI001BFFFE7B|nr:helix-turn-helix transcriptional regulator [Lysobacter capsici]MBW8809085.1 helix-turn-helix transcriptional regulator [Lysobacter sp.]QWF15011.1 helix-turn-helix transcriptional regulator [Lysobacter capsici]
MNDQRPVGELLRDWRQRRRLTQLDLADLAQISTRHVSFIETGRSLPSRAMLLRLADRLDVPLRERNQLMTAAGLAPMYSERSLDHPALHEAFAAIELVLYGHEPHPALAIDRHWNLIAHNRAVGPLLAGLPDFLLAPPANVLRASLHPEGLATRIVNPGEWRAHILHRLRHQIDTTGDPVLQALYAELAAYPAPEGYDETELPSSVQVALPFRLRTELGELSFISTTTVFGTPMDVTLSELAIESFFPADAATAQAMRAFGASLAPHDPAQGRMRDGH